MAKQSGVFSINDLNKALTKNSKFGALLSDGGGTSKISEYISTGNYMLNACMSGSILKGIPNNRSVCLSGESGVGKTFLLLNMCREAQKKGYFVIYYDSENAVDGEVAENFGIDLSLFRYEPVQTIQEFRSNVTNIIDTLIEQKELGNKIPKLFIALDSAGNLASQKEIDDAKTFSDKADMSRAKMMKSLFRIMMSKLGIIEGSFIFTNHIYKTMDLYSQDIQSGGCLVPGSKVLMDDGKYKNIEDIRVGDYVMTLAGEKAVEEIYSFDKPTVSIEFEDGSVIECSEDHRFYIGNETDDFNDNKNWIYAKDIISGDIVKQVNN